MNTTEIIEKRNKFNQCYVLYKPDGSIVYRNHFCNEVWNRYFQKEIAENPLGFTADPYQFKRYCVFEMDRLGYTFEAPEPKAKTKKGNNKRHHRYINIHLVDQAFGGREEGGWYYTCGSIEYSIKVSRKRLNQELAYWKRWVKEQNKNRNSNIYSVLSEGCYSVEVDNKPGESWPTYRPRYE